MKMMLKLLLIVAIAALASCGARQIDDQIERGQFALDSGDWDAAISYGHAALDADPANVEAALLLSSAYAGRSGFGVMKLTAAIADATRQKDIFSSVRDAMENTIHNPDDLHEAIKVLIEEFMPMQPDHIRYDDVGLQTALLMLIEAFGIPAIAAQPISGGPIDVRNITPAMQEVVERDLIAADNRELDSGISPADTLITGMRITYCVLRLASGSTDRFSLDALRDLVHCQLAPNDGAELSAANGDFLSPDIISCTDFQFDICAEAGDTQ